MTIRDSNTLFLEVVQRAAVQGVGIEVDIYDKASLATMVATLEGAYEAGIKPVLDDTGSGSFKIPTSDPKYPLIDLNSYMKVKVDGVYEFSFFVDSIDEITVSPNGDGAEIATIGGRGALSFLERSVIYPDNFPVSSNLTITYTGVTKAHMLIDQLTKAQARGGLVGLTWDFTDTTDSRGEPWSDTNTLTLSVGTDLLALAKSLSSMPNFDVEMTPSLKLRAYNAQGADVSTAVVLREGRHIGGTDMTDKESAPGASTVLVSGQSGGAASAASAPTASTRERIPAGQRHLKRHKASRPAKSRMLVASAKPVTDGSGNAQYAVEVNDAAIESEAGIGRRESFLSYPQGGDMGTLQAAGQSTLAQLADQGDSLTVPVSHGTDPGDYEPFFDYGMGDFVSLDVPGSFEMARYRIVAMSLAQLPGGDFSVELSFNSLHLEHLLRLKKQVDGLSGSTGGGVGDSQPGSSVVLGGPPPGTGGFEVAVDSTDGPGYLNDKLVVATGPLSKAVIGAGASQQLQLSATVATVGTLAGRPAASAANAGTFYFATDIAGGTLYLSTGSAWDACAPGVTSGGAYIPTSVGTTEGDTLYYHAGVWTRLPVGAAGTVIHGGTDPAYSAVVEGDLSLSDVTTGNVSATKHGFAPKLTNTGTKFLRDDGTYATPAGGGGTTPTYAFGRGDASGAITIPADSAKHVLGAIVTIAAATGDRLKCSGTWVEVDAGNNSNNFMGFRSLNSTTDFDGELYDSWSTGRRTRTITGEITLAAGDIASGNARIQLVSIVGSAATIFNGGGGAFGGNIVPLLHVENWH